MEFFNTGMGKQYYQGTMPRIAKSLERIADSLEQKANNERWILVRMGPFDHRGACDFNVIHDNEKRYYPSYRETRSAMIKSICAYLREEFDRDVFEIGMDEIENVVAEDGLDLQYGDYAAEIYRGDTYVQIWKIMRLE